MANSLKTNFTFLPLEHGSSTLDLFSAELADVVPAFSIVMPVKNEYDLLQHSLPACYRTRPSEIILCFDKPAPSNCVEFAEKIASKHLRVETRILEVDRNPAYRFNQAWVRRTGFRKARYDRILTVDADLIINCNVRKGIRLVGRDNVGLVSLEKITTVTGAFGFWRTAAHQLVRVLRPTGYFSGLYCFWRPFWLDSEDEGIKDFEDPERSRKALGSLAGVGEDIYLRNCMEAKHRVIHLRDIGAYCMTRDFYDVPRALFQLGRYGAAQGYGLSRALLNCILFARFAYLQGYIYQRSSKEEVPTFNPMSYSYGVSKQSRDYWVKSLPMVFNDSRLSYEEKRRSRYESQEYMQESFAFEKLDGDLVLDLGSGSGIDSCEMIRHGAKVVSLDFSPLNCKATKSLLRETRLEGDVVMASASRLPFRSNVFDVIYSYGVVHHIPNVREVLVEIKRCLRLNGTFMGMVYNRDSLLYAYSLQYLHGIKEGLYSEGLTEVEVASQFSERKEGNPYTKCYTKDELKDLLSAFFKDVAIQTRYNVIDTQATRKIKFQLDNNTQDLGWHLVFRAIKSPIPLPI